MSLPSWKSEAGVKVACDSRVLSLTLLIPLGGGEKKLSPGINCQCVLFLLLGPPFSLSPPPSKLLKCIYIMGPGGGM